MSYLMARPADGYTVSLSLFPVAEHSILRQRKLNLAPYFMDKGAAIESIIFSDTPF